LGSEDEVKDDIIIDKNFIKNKVIYRTSSATNLNKSHEIVIKREKVCKANGAIKPNISLGK